MTGDVTHILWSFRRCPYAMRARLAIAVSGIEVELREILLRDKPEAFRAASAKATVPVLQCGDGKILEESRDIMFWALEQSDPQDWLAPWRRDQQQVKTFLERLDGSFKTHLDRYKYASRFDPEEATANRDAGAEFLGEIDQTLSHQPTLSGDRAGIMDYASLPFVRQFRIADENWFDAQSWPHLHEWLQQFLQSQAFAAIMQKYPPWQPGEVGVRFPAVRSGL